VLSFIEPSGFNALIERPAPMRVSGLSMALSECRYPPLRIIGVRLATPLQAYKPTRLPGFRELLDVFRNQFGHLEHADLALSVEYRPERVIGVDHRSFFLILATILLNVVPEFFRQLRAREWS
jgi:hypothetical protein